MLNPLKIVRFWLPAAIFVAGAVMLVVSPDIVGIEGAALMLGGGLGVVVSNRLHAAGVQGEQDRDKERGGVVKLLPAFLVGLGISAVASLGWIIGWEIVLASGFDYEALMNEMTKRQAAAGGATGAALEQKIAESQAFMKLYMENPLVRVPITFIEMFPVGVLISLISALLLRNSRFMPARQAVA